METFNTCLGNRVNLETLLLTIRLVAHSSLLANRAVSILLFQQSAAASKQVWGLNCSVSQGIAEISCVEQDGYKASVSITVCPALLRTRIPFFFLLLLLIQS